jgi:hypothetical protein
MTIAAVGRKLRCERYVPSRKIKRTSVEALKASGQLTLNICFVSRLTPFTKRWKGPCCVWLEDEIEMVVSAMVREKTMPVQAGLKTL